VNPGSGKGGPSVDELTAAAEALEVEVHVLAENQDLGELARGTEADVLGMAGGDGSLGTVAAAAIERDVPFVCVPWGTRNHFASDIGLDSSEPLAALTAFREGHERRVDVGRVGERVFLNNVSLGIYARLVHRRERRRRRREIFARLRAIVISLRERRFTERFVVDGVPVRASAVLVANNEYRVDLWARAIASTRGCSPPIACEVSAVCAGRSAPARRCGSRRGAIVYGPRSMASRRCSTPRWSYVSKLVFCVSWSRLTGPRSWRPVRARTRAKPDTKATPAATPASTSDT